MKPARRSFGTSTGRLLGAALGVAGLLVVNPVLAQSWWPWGDTQQRPAPPVPREPVYPQNRPPVGPGQPLPPPGPSQPYSSAAKPPICLQLEQRLALESNRGQQSREVLPRIENDMRQADRNVQVAQSQLDRGDCYEYFLFAKSLRRTRVCVDLAAQVDAAKRRVADLEAQRQQILQSGSRSLRDDIIRELARNNCGAGYQQEARNSSPFSGLWNDEDSGGPGGNRFGTLPYATYKTICVRLCDGYYFPVSFSTLPNYFDRDADVCSQKCAAPAELYFHQNPGAAMEQAMSFKTKQPYTSLKTAFRYRKEYVAGCSCKQAEYVPSPSGPGAPERRTDAAPAQPAAGGPGGQAALMRR